MLNKKITFIKKNILRVYPIQMFQIGEIVLRNLFMKFLILFFIFSNVSLAFYKKVEKIVIGFGETPKEAVEAALQEAIKSTYGFSLEGTFEGYTEFREKIKDTETYSLNSRFVKKIKGKYKGFVDSYKILKINKENLGYITQYVAKLKVTLKVYAEPGINSLRRKIVIYPFSIENTNIKNHSKNKLKNIFYDILVTYFTGSRKFLVLNRENEDKVYKELFKVTSPFTDKKEILKLGKQLVADYILVGKINNLFVRKKVKGSKELGWYTEKNVLTCDVSYKVISISTNQIKYSNVLHIEEKLNRKLNYKTLTKAFRKIAKKIEEDIIFAIFPPRIIYVNDKKEVVINYGDKILKVNDIFDVYKIQNSLYDPYTKEFIDYNLKKIGTVKIFRTFPKYSLGKIVEGTVCINAVLYPKKDVNEKNNKKEKSINHSKSSVKVLPGGGVILPWDRYKK